MRLPEYLHEELSRLPARFNRALASGGESAALIYLRKQLSMLELVLDGDAPLRRWIRHAPLVMSDGMP